ncbi:MAG: hypothetical protein K6E68_07475 [Lachnospiraceae bacterium]|nr:hypothetical protein [Lachnospiraceae bacterium]
MNLKNVTKLTRITKPKKLGDKLLILATAPCVSRFFESEKVREQFKDYDLAFINSMVLESEDWLHEYKPRYLIFLDGWFLYDNEFGVGVKNEFKSRLENILDKITWECYLVTPILSELKVNNPHIQCIYLNILSSKYSSKKKWLYKNNLMIPGANNVVMGAIYFGITFEYKEIGLLGFTYRTDNDFCMEEDGLHGEDYAHYYDLDVHPYVVKNEEIFDKNGECFLLRQTKRQLVSTQILCDLANYAKDCGTVVTNYTPKSRIDMFRYKKLEQ